MNMINTKNITEAKKLIKKSKKPIIIKSQNTTFDRKIIESGKFEILLSPETKGEKDHPKYLDSGLNHVIAKIAAKNKIAIGIDLKKIQSLEKKQKAKTLARIKQNIKVCRKAKCKLIMINYKDKKDAQNLLLSLGASTKQAKEAIENL